MEASPEEAKLVDRARRGSASAFEALLRMHQTVAYRTAFAITRSAEDAEDVLQLAFVKAHGSLERFRPGAPFRPWLLTIVGNEARNWRRGSVRRLALVHRSAQVGRSLAAPSAEVVALAGDERRDLIDAVEELPPTDRMAIVTRYFVGLSLEETAAVLGVGLGAAKTRVSRALARLREALEEAS